MVNEAVNQIKYLSMLRMSDVTFSNLLEDCILKSGKHFRHKHCYAIHN